MKFNILMTVCILCLLSHGATADEEEEKERQRRNHNLNWSYLEASDLTYDMDFGGIDVEPDGYRLKLALELGDSLFAIVDRGRAEGSFAGNDYDFDTEGYGLGFHGDSWFISYSRNNWEIGQAEFDVDTTRLGFRNRWTDKLEFNASYSWNHVRGVDNEDGFQLGFAYELWHDFNLTAGYETIGGHLDIDQYSFGVRLDF
ncbi:MAG: hypothetical protein WDZ76_08625 [Pseudohongiellaceae bacterium]